MGQGWGRHPEPSPTLPKSSSHTHILEVTGEGAGGDQEGPETDRQKDRAGRRPAEPGPHPVGATGGGSRPCP
jgi:hypothetical protein